MSKKKSSSASDAKEKLGFMLAEIIENARLCEVRNRFPIDFRATTVEEGVHQIFKVVDENHEIVIKSNKYAVIDALLVYAQSRPGLGLEEVKQAREGAEIWQATTRETSFPPAFRWLDEPGLTFARLPWPKGVGGSTPTWDALMERMSNAKPFMAWIGSLFVPESVHQQYVWCYGDGGNGKSAIDRFLAKVFGAAYASEEPPERGDKFWTSGLIGKRLVVFPDCNAKGFPATGKFKSLCANDAMRIEIKKGGIYSLRLNCRFMFMSNEMPSLSTEAADMRRIIYCELGKPSEREMRASFEEDLWTEGGAFITKCIDAYFLNTTDCGAIMCPTDEIEAWASTRDADFDEIFSSNFRKLKLQYVTEDGEPILDREQPFANPSEVNKTITMCIPRDPRRRDAFHDYLLRVHKIRKKRVRLAPTSDSNNKKVHEYRYVGLEVIKQAASLSVGSWD